MKISELKQPYRRMAEYLGRKNVGLLDENFTWSKTNHDFWEAVDNGVYPPIAEEVKKHFPPDFDFSGEEDVINKFRLHTRDKFKNVEIPFNFNIFNSMLKKEVKDTFYLDAKEYYTQLAKEGKFDELPDTCEFSEPVELEVWDSSQLITVRQITGKYKDMYVDDDFDFWDNAKLPTPKIDFSQFKSGDVVEVECVSSISYGYIDRISEVDIFLTFGQKSISTTVIKKEDIKSITKIK